MKDLGWAGLILAGTIAVVAMSLQLWESKRTDWIPDSRPGRLSKRMRGFGLVLIWVEALIIAIGSLVPTEGRNDRILFVSLWALAGLLAMILVVITFADSLLRLMVGRAIVAKYAKSRNRRSMLESPDFPDDDLGREDN
jgi:hypothetical protein